MAGHENDPAVGNPRGWLVQQTIPLKNPLSTFVVRSTANKVLENGLKNSKDLFKQNSQRTEKWMLELIRETNNSSLQNTNNTYLQSIGERSISYKLSVQGGFRDFSTTIFLSMLFNKMVNLKSVTG